MMTYLLTPKASSKLPGLPPLCIMVPIPSLLKLYLARGPVEQSKRFDFVTISTLKHEKKIVAGPFTGAPAAALLMERLIPGGVSKFVLFGTCGSLRKEVGIGDIVIPGKGESEEGVSSLYGYPDKAPAPDNRLRSSLLAASESCPAQVHRGGVWSTDAPFMETEKKVEYFLGQGVDVVDMESTALFSVACRRSVQVASVLVVSDLLLPGEWKPGFYDKRFKRGVKSAIEIISSFGSC